MRLLLTFLLLPPVLLAETFSIAAVADVQYADTAPRGDREPAEGIPRLKHAISEWNKRELDFGVILGDVIDWDDIDYGQFPQKTVEIKPFTWKHTKAVLATWKTLKAPGHLILGNHDYYVPYRDADGLEKPASVYRAFGFKDSKAYYDFAHKGYRFIVLDGDLSPFNYALDTPEYKKAKAYFDAVKGPQRTPWNAGISEVQLQWLEGILKDAAEKKQPTVVMCHYPIHEPIRGHSLLNSQEVSTLLDRYPNVVMWLNGHNHKGDYKKVGTRHHLNLKGMQNEAENWYQLDFSPTQITVYQAEDTTTPVYTLDFPSL